MKRHTKLLLALVAGIGLGGFLHGRAGLAAVDWISANIFWSLGQIFLRLIFMVVVPLVFSALVLGVCELGQSHGLGRVAAKTLFYTLIVSACSVIIGVTLVNVLKPGAGFEIDQTRQELLAGSATDVATIQAQAQQAKSAAQALVDLIPKNPLDSAVRALDGEMLSLMLFALVFGLALSALNRNTEVKNPLIGLLEQLFAVSMKIIDYAMALAPYAVFALVFNTIYKLGFEVLLSLLFYVLVVVAGLLIQQFVVYGTLLRVVAKRSPWQFFKACQDVYLYAFSTASSNATLPETLATAEHKLKLPSRIARFVLTVGATANQNGTALFEGVTVLFLAQVYGKDLSTAQQVTVVIMSILAGIGTAGVPGGSLPLIMVLLLSMGIPAEGMALILGVDRFLDMCRTTINVSGDLVITALVSGKEDANSVPVIAKVPAGD